MKKILVLTLFLFLNGGIASAQFQIEYVEEFFTQRIINDMDAVIDKRQEVGKHMVIWVNVPSYYNFDLIRSRISRIIRSYNDIQMITSWEKQEGETYVLGVLVDDKIMIIAWSIETDSLIFIWDK